jgi:hypothetical protein
MSSLQNVKVCFSLATACVAFEIPELTFVMQL